MRYITIDEPRKDGTGDMYNDEFETAAEAIKAAKLKLSYLTTREKKERRVYVLKSINPDEEAPDHFDGDPIFTAGEEAEE